jgi:hypothetical protein
MTQPTLEQLMMIKINGGSILTHAFDEAAAIFFGKKVCRLKVGSAHTTRPKSDYT